VQVIVHSVDPHQVRDGGQRARAVRARGVLADVPLQRLERVQHDLLQQLPERHPLELGQPFQHLDQALLHPDPELHPLNPLGGHQAPSGRS
jgi:hypothetical protein